MTDASADGKISPLISVAMPVYNGARFLAESVESILAQTQTDFELIIVDDGSTDSSLEILLEYQKKDARIRLFSHENTNVAAVLNEIILLARGRWIARMDQDDIALPQRFERQLAWLEKTGSDVCGSWVQRFGTEDKRVVKLRQSDEAIKMELLFSSPLAHPSIMVSAAKIRELGYDDTRWEAEDYDLWERAVEAGWRLSNVPEVLLHYRVHPSQISAQKAQRQQQLAQEIQRRYWNFLADQWQLDRTLVEKALNTFESRSNEKDMDAVESVFSVLLLRTQGEARETVFHHMTRFFLKVAPGCSDIVSRWTRMNARFGNGAGLSTKLQLLIFRIFQIRAGGRLYKQIRKLYIWKASH